jgi:hypothetical protein
MVPPVDVTEVDTVKALSAKVAVTLRAWDMVTVQFPVPVHDPDHPEKVEPADCVAVRVTTVL